MLKKEIKRSFYVNRILKNELTIQYSSHLVRKARFHIRSFSEDKKYETLLSAFFCNSKKHVSITKTDML